MGSILPDEGFNFEGEGIIHKVKGMSSKTSYNETILLYTYIPFVIIGLISNALVLWIWLSVKTKFYDSVYLFRAMAVADFLFVVNYMFVHHHTFHSAHIRLFFMTICFGNRYISNYITLILAIARFIRLFYPFKVRKMLSRFRLGLTLMLITFFILLLTVHLFAFKFFNAQNSIIFYNYAVTKAILTSMPVLAENVIMFIVVFKLRQFSKTFEPPCDANPIHLPEQIQIPYEQKNEKQTAQKLGMMSSVQTGHSLALEHRETGCDAGPRDQRNPVNREETVQSDQTLGGQVNTRQRSLIFETDLDCIEEIDSVPEAEPQNSKQGHPTPGPVPGPSDERSTLQPVSASNKLHQDIDTGVTYVVLALCLFTFVSEVFCTLVKTLFYQASFFKTPLASFTCNVIIIISHSISLVFYLFMNSFRQTLLTKGRRLIGNFSSNSVKKKSAQFTTVVTEGKSLNSITGMRLPHISDDMTTGKLQVCSSSRLPYGREGMAASLFNR